MALRRKSSRSGPIRLSRSGSTPLAGPPPPTIATFSGGLATASSAVAPLRSVAPLRRRSAPTSTDSPLRTTRVRKSAERTSEATFTLRPIRAPARDHRTLADDRDPGVESVRLLLVRSIEVGSVADDRALADDDLLVEDCPVDHRARADDAIEHHDRVAHDGTHVDAHARRQHGVHHHPVDLAAVTDEAAVDLGGGADLGRCTLLGLGVDDPVVVVQVELGVVGQQRHVGFPVGLDRADVLPVAVELVAEDARVAIEHGRDHVLAEVHEVIAEPAPERTLREDVDAHGGEVALGLFRLLLPVDDAVGLVERQDAHPRRIGQRNAANRDRHVGTAPAVGSEERRVVHLVDVVAGQDEDRVGGIVLDLIEVLEHGIGRPAVPLGTAPAGDVRLAQANAALVPVEVPRPAEPDVVVERARVVLRQDDHVRDVRVHAVRQGEVDDPVLAAERDRGLGALLRQDREPLALAARKDHRHGLLHARSPIVGRRRVGAPMLARGWRTTGVRAVAVRSTSRDRSLLQGCLPSHGSCDETERRKGLRSAVLRQGLDAAGPFVPWRGRSRQVGGARSSLLPPHGKGHCGRPGQAATSTSIGSCAAAIITAASVPYASAQAARTSSVNASPSPCSRVHSSAAPTVS